MQIDAIRRERPAALRMRATSVAGGRRHSLSPDTISVSNALRPQASVCTAKPCDEGTAPPSSEITARS